MTHIQDRVNQEFYYQRTSVRLNWRSLLLPEISSQVDMSEFFEQKVRYITKLTIVTFNMLVLPNQRGNNCD